MTIKEVLSEIESQEENFMGKKMGDAGHIIIGFEVIKNSEETYTVNLLAQDNRSGSPIVKKSFYDWKDGK